MLFHFQFWIKIFYLESLLSSPTCFSSPRTLTKEKTSPWPNLLFSFVLFSLHSENLPDVSNILSFFIFTFVSLSKIVSNYFQAHDFYCFSRTVFKQEKDQCTHLFNLRRHPQVFFRHVHIPRIEILLPLIVMEKPALFYSSSHFLSDDVTRFVVNWNKTVEMWWARKRMLVLRVC